MKKFLFALALLAGASSAQAQTIKTKVKQKPGATVAPPATTPLTVAATPNLEEYAGTYAVQGLPFSEMVFSVENGQPKVKAGERGGTLTPTQEADTFDSGGQAVIHFQRDDSKKITGLSMEAAGSTFNGQKK
jgi:hypothetical protein